MWKTATVAGAFLGGFFMAKRIASHNRFSFRNRLVVITGGSRGLGLVLARQLVGKGANVVIMSRSEGQLRRAEYQLRAGGTGVLGIACDVRDPSQVNAAMSEVARRFGKIDVLINNAGMMQVGPVDSMTVQDYEDALAVHLYGALHTTMAVLRHMRRAGAGRIVNIASIGGKIGIPHMIPYCASKFALVGFSEALRAELRREHIYVTTICPGLMRTGSSRNALFKGDHRAEHAWFSVSGSLPLLSMSAERAAAKILSACQRNAARVVLGVPAKLAVLSSGMAPNFSTAVASLANRMLPSGSAQKTHLGHQSQSKSSPSILTRLNDLAALRNNEIPLHG